MSVLKDLFMEEQSDIYDLTQEILDNPEDLIDETIYDIVESSLNLSILPHHEVMEVIREATREHKRLNEAVWREVFNKEESLLTETNHSDIMGYVS